VNKEMHIDILRRLRDEVRRKRLKKCGTNRVSPSRPCSSTPVSFGQEFYSKEQYDNNAASPILSRPSSRWFLHVPTTEIITEGKALLWFYWHH